jgi:hypothetical protein
MKWTASLLQGNGDVVKMLPPRMSAILLVHVSILTTSLQIEWYINVTDVARIHAIALLDPNVKSERLFAFAAAYRWTDVVAILRKLRPENKSIPNPPENELSDLSDVVPAKRAESLLKSFFGRDGWVGLEESLREGIDSVGF